MFTVAEAILEVLTVLQELNVIHSALFYCAWNCSSKGGTQKVKDLGIRFFRFPQDKECVQRSGQQLSGV